MSLNRAGLNHSLSWRVSAQLGSASDPFHFILELKIDLNGLQFQLSFKDLFFIISYNKLVLKMTKLCVYIKLFNSKNTFGAIKTQTNDYEIYWNYGTGAKLGNCQLGFSSKIGMPQPSPTWLGTLSARLSSGNSSSNLSLLYTLQKAKIQISDFS